MAKQQVVDVALRDDFHKSVEGAGHQVGEEGLRVGRAELGRPCQWECRLRRVHARQQLVVRFTEHDFAVLGLARHLFHRGADGDGVKLPAVVRAGVHQFAALEIEHQEFFRKPDGHVAGHPRGTVALGVRQQVLQVYIGEPSARQEHARIRVSEAGDVGWHGREQKGPGRQMSSRPNVREGHPGCNGGVRPPAPRASSASPRWPGAVPHRRSGPPPCHP